MINFQEALTFDDVLLVPKKSDIMPDKADISTIIAPGIKLQIPIMSSAMDTVTEAPMAIVMAQRGGIGCIHRNMSVGKQYEEVRKVKKFESGMVMNPITINSDATLKEALKIRNKHHISSIPVINKENNKLVGVLSNRDIRFVEDTDSKVSDLMTTNLITVKENISRKEAKQLLHKNRIEKLMVVDKEERCIGIITVNDIEKSENHPESCRDKKGRLCVAAAVGAGTDHLLRVENLIDAEVDLIVVDTAHGHSQMVLDTVKKIRSISDNTPIMAGNVVTTEAAEDLIAAGASCIKVGVGPGSICTTRIIAGVGVPQLTAIMEIFKICKKRNIPIIADGGIKYSGDIAKAIACGANAVMIGSLFAGSDESPGELVLYQGKSYKSYRGMGSVGAMSNGSADRYFQKDNQDKQKFVPEGVEGLVPYKSSASKVIHQLTGGLRAAMGYTGNATIKEMQENCSFVKITNAGLKESHPHGVKITREATNYCMEG